MPTFFNIIHHGAVSGVTGSCHELRLTDGPGMLIDCGLFQGAETSGSGAGADSLNIDFPVEHIKALVVTHVHIDHVGRIPYLLAAGFEGPIICTEPTAQLLPLVLEDAVKIGITRDKRLVKLFLKKVADRIVAVPYRQWHPTVMDDNGGISIKFQPAGHILGSAYVECDVTSRASQPSGEQHRVVFSGDLGAPHAPLLAAPKAPYKADTLVIESTYGDRLHQGRRERSLQLKRVVERSLEDNGAVLIPAFSIGRTQEILYEIEGLIHRYSKQKAGDKRWQDIEVIVDSPLAANFTKVYRKLKPYWDAEALGRVSSKRHPLSFEQLYTVDDHAQHQTAVDYIKNRGHPCIVIAASGMCVGGRMMNYLKALIEDRRTDILFIGYQASGTPGWTIQRYGPRGGWVELDNQRYSIKAKVHTISSYSAHADQQDLVNFVKRMQVKPRQIRIVHGDDRAKEELRVKYEAMVPEAEVIIPN